VPSRTWRKPFVGGALLRGWINEEAIGSSSIVIDPTANGAVTDFCKLNKVLLLSTEQEIPDQSKFDVLIFAVKPQMANAILPNFVSYAGTAICISVMAGASVASIASDLGGAKKIIRTMPNIPASVGAGMTGLYATADVSDKEREIASTLMQAVGEVAWVESEAGIDFVTAVSGSGPAYFFLLTEALAEAGCKVGLDMITAQHLARQTAVGAGRLLELDPRDVCTLRESVTSPGGTTAAALSVLDSEKGFRNLLRDAVQKATQKAIDLSV